MSPLLVVISMMLLDYKLRKCTGSYKFTKSKEKINRLVYIGLTQTIRAYIQYIRSEFDIEKCAMPIMKSGKRQNYRRNKTAKSRKNQSAWRKGKLQVHGNIGSGHHQTSGDERKRKNTSDSERSSRRILTSPRFYLNLSK